jgi:hypothetical protein
MNHVGGALGQHAVRCRHCCATYFFIRGGLIMLFTLRGQRFELSKEEVERTMGGVLPSRGKYYFVVVNGQKYPPNQVLYLTLRRQHPDLSLADFSNYAAKNVLSQVGFELLTEGGN